MAACVDDGDVGDVGDVFVGEERKLCCFLASLGQRCGMTAFRINDLPWPDMRTFLAPFFLLSHLLLQYSASSQLHQ